MKALKKRRVGFVWLAILALVVVVAGACYIGFRSNLVDNQATANEEVNVSQPTDQPQIEKSDVATGTVITTGDSQYGPMLFDSRGQAIYIWQLEDSSTAKCYGDCVEEWPPVLTDGTPIAQADVNGKLLGTTLRTNGTTQVTYNGHPLYYYAHEKPGEVECHNISTHGGLWWVIQPSGNRAK